MTVRLVAWGAYDEGKPRVRLLLAALRECDALAAEIHVSLWSKTPDKSIAGWKIWTKAAFRYLVAMPGAFWRLLRLPGDHAILLPYPGTPDIFITAIVARLRRRKLVLDAFLPIHDTIVRDREMVRNGSLRARLLKWIEGAGLRLADIVLTDTDAHTDFLAREYQLPRDRFVTVLVGAEPLFANSSSPRPVDDLVLLPDDRKIVLFYGQFIPLHGLETILEAVRLSADAGFHWLIVGKGQQEPLMREFLARYDGKNVTWLEWVEYERLPDLIARADLCLGVFGGSDKAARVIPNKVFQQLAMGKHVITRKSPAIAGLAESFPDAITTLPAEDSAALARAVLAHFSSSTGRPGNTSDALSTEFSPAPGVARLIAKLESD